MNRLEVLVLPGADHASALERPEFVTGLLGFLVRHREGAGAPPTGGRRSALADPTPAQVAGVTRGQLGEVATIPVRSRAF